MKRLLAICLALLLTLSCVPASVMAAPAKTAKTAKPNYPYRNVMYYGDWSVYGGQHNFDPCDMQGNLITHLNFAFMDFNAKGDLVLCDKFADFEKGLKDQQGMPYGGPYTGVFGGMLALRDKNPNLKLGVSVGGWTRCGDFPAVCASASKRANLVNNLCKFIDYLGFDFVDIDWEYPSANRKPDPEGNGVTIDEGCPGGPADGHNFTLLMKDLRAGLDELGAKNGKYYELSAAMSASPAFMDVIEFDQVLQYADFLNMMTYDLNGAWAPFTAHQSALYTNPAAENLTKLDKNAVLSIDSTCKYLKSRFPGLDMSKIVVGVCAYTRGWGGVHNEGYATKAGQANVPGLFATSKPNSIVAPDKTTSGTWSYGDIHEIKSRYNLKEYWDDVAKAPYLYSEGSGKDDGYFFTFDNVKSVKLKGQYVRQNGLGGLIAWMASQDPNEELTRAMKESLYGGAAIPDQPIIVGEANAKVTVKAAENGSIALSLINQSKPSEHNEALVEAEKYKKTIMLPKLYINTKNGTTFRAGMMAGTVSGNTVDLSPVYDASTLKAGTSHEFTLIPSDPNFKISDITSITLTQRMNKNMHEFGEQVVYGDANYDPSKVSSVELDKDTLKLNVGQDAILKAAVNPNTAENKNVTWETSDKNVATVKDGKVVAVAEGAAVIKVVTEDGAFSATCKVMVKDPNKETTPVPTSPVVTDPTDPEPTTPKPTTPDPDQKPAAGKLPAHLVTGYWHNFCNGSTNLKLSDVPACYDLINVAFTNSTGKAGEATFEIDPELARALGGYTDKEFISDIKALQAKGQHVIISVGGQNGRISITSEAAAKTFTDSMIKIIDKYGFEGIDIDLEGTAVAGTQYIASSLHTLADHYGKDFIITMAPETVYVFSPSGSYSKLAAEIKDILTICYPQFYNSGSMNGYDGMPVSQGTADMMTSISTTLIEKVGLRDDQIGFGVPATNRAAGGGFYSFSEIDRAVNAFVNGTKANRFTAPHAYPGFRSMMTWSINWDATQNYAWGNHMSDLMDSLGNNIPAPTDPQPTDPQPTDPQPTDPQPIVVKSVKLNKHEVKLGEGKTLTLRASVSPANADDKTITWTSSNPNVATVVNGKITAVNAGSAIIVAKSVNGKSDSCVVNVIGSAKPTDPEPTTAPTDPAPTTAPTDPEPTTAPTDPEPTTAPTDPIPDGEWRVGVNYKIGDVVTYQGKEYKCTYAHKSQADWAPGVAFTLWAELNGAEPTDPEPTTAPTDPEPTTKPTDPEPTDPEPTDPEPTDPQPTDPADPTIEEWAPTVAYADDALVTYKGVTYKCVQGHTSLGGWEPSNVPALWAPAGK